MKSYFRGGLFKEVTVDMKFLPISVSDVSNCPYWVVDSACMACCLALEILQHCSKQSNTFIKQC